MNSPKISVVIPTFNGASKVSKLLTSILPQENVNFEVQVVIDGSNDNTVKVLQQLNDSRIALTSQTNQGRSVTRNNGVAHSTGNLLVFLDDDMRLPGKDVLAQHVAHHREYPNSILVGKVVVDSSLLQNDFDHYLHFIFSKRDTGYTDKTKLTASNLKFTTQHLSMPKDLFEKLGGFDTRLTDAEDYDLGMRALQMDIPIFYDPSILAYHDDFPSCSKYVHRQIEYKKSHQKLKELGKVYLKDLFPPVQKPSSVRGAIAKLFSSKKWVEWVEKETLLFLPNSMRYRLYAEIVYANTLKGLGLLV